VAGVAAFAKEKSFALPSLGESLDLLGLLALGFFVIQLGFIFHSFGSSSTSFDEFLTLKLLLLHH
jgi:hypothetical protein